MSNRSWLTVFSEISLAQRLVVTAVFWFVGTFFLVLGRSLLGVFSFAWGVLFLVLPWLVRRIQERSEARGENEEEEPLPEPEQDEYTVHVLDSQLEHYLYDLHGCFARGFPGMRVPEIALASRAATDAHPAQFEFTVSRLGLLGSMELSVHLNAFDKHEIRVRGDRDLIQCIPRGLKPGAIRPSSGVVEG